MQIFWFVDLINLALTIAAGLLGLSVLVPIIVAWLRGWCIGLATSLPAAIMIWAVLDTDLVFKLTLWLVYLPEIV